MRPIQAWFDEYAVSHQNATNTAIHWICVPTIYFCVVGLLVSIPPLRIPGIGHLSIAVLAVAFVLYYFVRSKSLWLGMTVFSLLCLGSRTGSWCTPRGPCGRSAWYCSRWPGIRTIHRSPH